MWKSKKFVIIAVLASVVVAGSVVGVALADTGTGTTSANMTLLDRVAAKLNINPQNLQGAFTQARQEARDKALDDYLNTQITAGKITADQAAQYKAWVKAKPTMPAFGPQKFGMHRFGGRGGMMGGWGTPAPSPTK